MSAVRIPAPSRRARPPAPTPSRVRAALALGLALTAVAGAVVLSGSPSTVAASNGIGLETRFGRTLGPATVCQSGETLPAHTSAVRIALEAAVGPSVRLAVFSSGRQLTHGARGSGWTGGSVTVPVAPLARPVAHATVCFSVPYSRVHLAILGAPAAPTRAARFVPGGSLRGRMIVEYMRAGAASWWAQAESVARRMGLGRAVSGTWIALVAALLALALVALVCRASLRELEPRAARRLPAAAWGCALAALLNALCWSLITPPFQVPDESAHYAYVQTLAENHRLPSPTLSKLSPALEVVLLDLHSAEISFNPSHRSLVAESQQRQLELDQRAGLSSRGPGGADQASTEPPVYYALQLVPYALGSFGSVLARLQLMRLLSSVFAAITALFAFLFVREALPRSRWAWTVGGMAVALFPLLGFISGGVNPDAMLYAVCAALYYCLARGFRRGLTPRLALTIGALTALGFLTKLNFVGFAPAVLVGLALLAVRARSGLARDGQAGVGVPWRWLALASALALAPAAIYALVNLASNHAGLGAASETLGGLHGSTFDEVSYVWQFYLPLLPGMPNYFTTLSSTSQQLWLNGLIGLYGWSDTLFASWVYELTLIPLAGIAALCARELARRRRALRGRLAELSVYALTCAGVMIVVGVRSYTSDVLHGTEPYWEPRYLLPMLPLWGCVVALAARGAGRRWGPPVGALLIVLLLAHDLFSQLQVISRYYG